MPPIRFEQLTTRNMRDFVRLTRETLWMPAYAGDEALRSEIAHWPPPSRDGAHLIRDGRELVGRMVAPGLDDWLIIRDVGLQDRAGLAGQVAIALLGHARTRGARTVRVMVHERIWEPLAALGVRELKRRITMRRDLRAPPLAFGASNLRTVTPRDEPALAELLHAAYEGTVDGEDGDLEGWRQHAGDIFRALYGAFVPQASFVTPAEPPFRSASLVVESAPACGVLGQVVTDPEHANQGHARRLISHSLAALARLGYQNCFLEVTLSNHNAVHLYDSLGFEPIGPQIVYGECRLP